MLKVRYYIRKILFRNCQSLGEIEYDLTPGLNVIIAPDNNGNSSGKSVLFKSLYTAVGADFFEASELKHLVSYGAESAAALFVLSDGSSGGFMATKKGLTYLFRPAEGMPIEKLTAPHHEFVRKMSIIMDAKSKFVLNVLDMDQELLFVNSREETNYSLLRLVSDNETLDDVIPAIEEETKSARTLLAKARMVNVEFQRRLNSLAAADIADIEMRLKYGQGLVPICRALAELNDKLGSLKPVRAMDYGMAERMLVLGETFAAITAILSRILPATPLDFAVLESLLRIAQTLNQMADAAESLARVEGRLRQVEREIKDMQDEVRGMGLEVVCPVRGMVCFFEEGCVETAVIAG